jgi:short-subunit dehydrogenase
MAESVFKDNVVVITGASAGIGLEIARQLADEGAKLVLAARSAELLDEAARECRAKGAEVLTVPTDVSDRAQCQALVDAALEKFGRIDTLVNNAGISMHARFDELHDIESVQKITAINYFGSVYCTWFALPHLKKTQGRIVAVSSVTGKNGVPTRTLYSGTKHAMAGFFDSLRIELRNEGVSVTVVYPGFVNTDIAERALGPNGQPLGTRPVVKNAIMTAPECARLTIQAAAKRKREVIMTGRARVAMIIKALWPGFIDKMAERGIKRGR